MAYQDIRDIATYTDGSGNQVVASKREYLIDSSADTATLPSCAPGSVAYTADLSYMAMFDGTAWTQIGGTSNA